MTDIIQNEWNVKWFELWKDIPNCLKAVCCGPCTICWNLEALGKEKGFGWFLACCSPMAGVAIARTLTREKYGIEGTDMQDWCLSCCCGACSEFQVAAEIKKRESGE